MTKDQLYLWSVFGIGALAGALVSMLWRAPTVLVDGCPKDVSGIWVCPQEWGTPISVLFAGIFAIVAAAGTFRAAKLREDRHDKRRAREKIGERYAFAIALSVELSHVAAECTESAETIKSFGDTPIDPDGIDYLMIGPTSLSQPGAVDFSLVDDPEVIDAVAVAASLIRSEAMLEDAQSRMVKAGKDREAIKASSWQESLQQTRDAALHAAQSLRAYADRLKAE